ncbi:lipopolysaccharide biosynthesis protein [Pseudomonas pergaminensis]
MKQISLAGTEPAGHTRPAAQAHRSGPRVSNNGELDLHAFESCRNTESGAVFIVASGLSAQSFPVEKFAHVPMITMNGAISMFLDTDVKPYFYACTDRSFSEQQPALFKHAMAVSQRVALWEDHARSSQARPTGRLYPLTKAKRPSWLESVLGKHSALVVNHPLLPSRERPLGFSKDMSEGFFDARTVAYLAIQLAFHVGFTQVFLVGVDLDQNAGRFYENRDTTNSPCGLDQHYFTRILPSFELMSAKVMGNDFMVYNLSDTSKIPDSVVPHVTLADVEAMLA